MNIKETVRVRISVLRAYHGMKQKQFAELCGCSPTQISGIEVGRTMPDLSTIVKIAEGMNVSLDWLCGIEQNEKRDGELPSAHDLEVLTRFFTKSSGGGSARKNGKAAQRKDTT